MATVTKSRRVAPVDPSPEQIAAECDAIRIRRLAEFDERADRREATEKKHRRKRRAALKPAAEPQPAAAPAEKPRPLTDRQRRRKLLYPTPKLWREQVQERWDYRREHNAFAADADARGVLSYYNVNRGPGPCRWDFEQDYREMTKADICNVDVGSITQLNAMLAQIPDSDDERYTLGPVDPETTPLRSVSSRDVRPFRTKRC